MSNEALTEIRHALLTDAREFLTLRWERRCDHEIALARCEVCVPSRIEPPTTQEILDLAEIFYTFVTKPLTNQ